MKKSRIIFITIIITCVISYFTWDAKLYYYGESKYNICNYSLPLGMMPQFMGTDVSYPIIGFAILDKDRFYIIAKENTYRFENDTIEIKEVLKYGFNDEKLIALVKDTSNHDYYVECLKNNDPRSKIELQINVLDGQTGIDAGKYKWIDVKNDEAGIDKIRGMRDYSALIFIVSVSVMVFWSMILRKKRNLDKRSLQ